LAVLGTITVGQETINSNTSYGVIKSRNNEWVIHGDGTAHFKNVTVSGKIETAIFEHEKVQTVAGTLLVTSQIPIKNKGIQLIEEYKYYAEIISDDAQNFINRLIKK
jgi:hypothetical protein